MLAQIISTYSELKTLAIYSKDSSLSSEGESCFGRLNKLESINIGSNDWVTDNLLAFLTRCQNLNFINLAYCNNITDDGIEHLNSLLSLKTLDISYIKKLNGKSLTGMRNVEDLRCSGCTGITKANFCKLIKHLTNLDKLNIRECNK